MEDWRKVFITQYNMFGTIAGLEVTALTVFAAFLGNPGNLRWELKTLFTTTALLLFIEVVFILWMLNQERKTAFNQDAMLCFRENESMYRNWLLGLMLVTWGFILSLLVTWIWTP